MTTKSSDVTYVDTATPPGANYVGDRGPSGMGPLRQVPRPPLTGHVHVRVSDRCIHNDNGPLCPDMVRPRR